MRLFWNFWLPLHCTCTQFSDSGEVRFPISIFFSWKWLKSHIHKTFPGLGGESTTWNSQAFFRRRAGKLLSYTRHVSSISRSCIFPLLGRKKIYWLTKETLQTFFAEGSNRNIEIWYLLYSNKWITATMLFVSSIVVVCDWSFMRWRHLLKQHLMPLRLITWPFLMQNVFNAFFHESC